MDLRDGEAQLADLDETPFVSFVAARSSALLSYAYLLTGDRETAEDLVQTALARTLLAWSRVRAKRDPEGYVRRTMANVQANTWRARRRHREDPVPQLPDLSPPGTTLAPVVDERDAMWSALAQLPPRQRAVLVLRFCENLTEQEVARVLGCRIGRIRRARRRRRPPATRPQPIRDSVEDLLRATLADDRRRLEAGRPILLSAITREADRLQRRRGYVQALAGLAAVSVVVAGSSVLVSLGNPRGGDSGTRPASSRPSWLPSPLPSASAPGSGSAPLPGAKSVGPVQDLRWTAGAVWVLDGVGPFAVKALDPATGSVLRQVQLPSFGSNAGLRVDPDTGVAWVWQWDATHGGDTQLSGYNGQTMTPVRRVVLPLRVYDLAAEHGRVWLATGDGLVRLDGSGASADRHLVTGTSGTFSLAVDRRRGRLLLDLAERLVAVDPASLRIVASSPATENGLRVIWTSDDHLWTGQDSGSGATVLPRDPQTLEIVGSGHVATTKGTGAMVWPGATVVWVRTGSGVGVSCLDAATGELRGYWPGVTGPVVSTPGRAVAVNDGELLALNLPPGCPG